MKTSSCLHSGVALLALASAGAAHGQEDAYVRGMSATCANCHGTNGRSVGSVPGLAAVDKAHIAQQMKDFKSGKRPATVMQKIAKGFTDEQIDQIAAYFAAQKR